MIMNKTALNPYWHRFGIVSLASSIALASVGCTMESAEGSSAVTGDIVAEVDVGAATRLLFVNEGNGDIGVAELSRTDKPSLVMVLSRSEGATPLEIFLATAADGEDAPALLVENHRRVAEVQGREDLEPRLLAGLVREDGPTKNALATWTTGTTPCTASGWEGATGVWGTTIHPSLNIFTNSTSVYNNNVTYPRTKSITQPWVWNSGSGSYHTHGACLSNDTGVDDKISFTMKRNGATVLGIDVFESANAYDYVLYEDWVGFGGNTTSEITNVNNSAATFRHSAAAWVPFPQ